MIDRSLFSLPGVKRVLFLLASCAILQGLIYVGQAWSLSSAITGLWYGGSLVDQSLWVAGFLLCFVGGQGVSCAQDAYLDRYAYERADALRRELLEKIFAAGSNTVQEQGTGNTTTLVLEGVEQVETYLRLVLPKLTRVLLVPLVLIIPVFVLDWVSGAVMVIVFPFIIFYMVLLGRMAQEKAAKQHKKFQLLSNHFIDSLRGLDTLKLFGITKQHSASIYEVSEQFRKATIKTLRVATLSGMVLDLFATLSVAAVAILLGLRLLDGSLILFPALTILVMAPEYFKPIREFAADFHASLDGKNALTSIRSLIDSPEKMAAEEEGTDLTPWGEESRFEASALAFSYSSFALKDISFTVSGTTKVGIIGSSGAGKSTLIKLLAGFHTPDEGKFCIDGASLFHLRQRDWQRQLAYLPQEPYIFHASLRDNLAFYHPEASAAEIAEAVKVVGLEGLVEELPHGLDTKIGESERALSGGQAQRIALARMCLDGSRTVLLFDEPTAHLDIETELELKERMLPLMEGRLVFFATHRLHWLQQMDLILVMEDGRITECGTLQELNARSESFTSLVSQLSEAKGGAA